MAEISADKIQDACLPIVDVPVHIVTGMPMTVGMGMRMAITMGTRKYIIGIAYGYSHGHAHYILAVPMTLSMGTLKIHNFVFRYYTSIMDLPNSYDTYHRVAPLAKSRFTVSNQAP